MERESNPMEALCRSGCGFYGNPSTDGLCSVCFKEALKKKQQPPATTPSPVSAPFVPAAAATPLAAAAPTVPSLPASPQAHTDVSHYFSCYLHVCYTQTCGIASLVTYAPNTDVRHNLSCYLPVIYMPYRREA